MKQKAEVDYDRDRDYWELLMDELLAALRAFNDERDWGQFHSPKNLATALMVEAGEIAEHFQWMSEADSRDVGAEKLEKIKQEIGDVMLYLLNLSDKLQIDPLQAAREKLEINRAKYPADKVKGKSLKYDEYE
ncbi:MAG: nucleotide pyrophosphohydrolase [Planctomycetota bacterium]|jgi:NTP pyrophosphatase (non-canonical NTP hydrolase)